MTHTLHAAVLALTLGTLAAGAHAAPIITFGGIADGGGSQKSAVTGVATVDFNGYAHLTAAALATGGATYTAQSGGGGTIVVGSIPGIAATPSRSNTTASLAVPSSAQPSASGNVEITFGEADHNYFGIFWGSIDTYNRIQFWNDGLLAWSGTGSTVANPANGCQTCAGTNRYINFDFGAARFDRIVLASDGRAFESDNHAFGTVPAPGALALLGIGLLAGPSATRRREA